MARRDDTVDLDEFGRFSEPALLILPTGSGREPFDGLNSVHTVGSRWGRTPTSFGLPLFRVSVRRTAS